MYVCAHMCMHVCVGERLCVPRDCVCLFPLASVRAANRINALICV